MLVLLMASGCNWVYGLEPTAHRDSGHSDADPRADLDRDGIADVIDPCIAPDADALLDHDGDGMPNGSDPCPFDPAATGDSDQDGVPNACDPFPQAGDRVRCVMAFSDPDVNVQLWRKREVSFAWDLDMPRQLLAQLSGTVAANYPFEGPSVTAFDVTGDLLLAPFEGRFAVLARAAPAAAATDVGCELVGSAGTWTLRTLPDTSVTTQVPSPGGASTVRYRVSVAIAPASPSGSNLRCKVQLGTAASSAAITRRVELAEGMLGFAVATSVMRVGLASITGIAIYERDDAALP